MDDTTLKKNTQSCGFVVHFITSGKSLWINAAGREKTAVNFEGRYNLDILYFSDFVQMWQYKRIRKVVCSFLTTACTLSGEDLARERNTVAAEENSCSVSTPPLPHPARRGTASKPEKDSVRILYDFMHGAPDKRSSPLSKLKGQSWRYENAKVLLLLLLPSCRPSQPPLKGQLRKPIFTILQIYKHKKKISSSQF